MNKLDEALKLLPISLKSDPVVIAMYEAAIIQLQELYDEAEILFDLLNIDKAPEELLDLLAFEKHVDFYDKELSVQQKRELIKLSVSWHRKKGTPSAIQHIFEILNIDSNLKEWFEYGGDPYLFKVIVNIKNKGINEKTLDLLAKLINESKNLRSHLEKIDIYFTTISHHFVGVATLTGEEITVYPFAIRSLSSHATIKTMATNNSLEVMTIYPEGGN